ncbi:MAG: IS21 family transposase [bacterium]|nr:IS21 family transposase [bacterium]
MAKERTSVRMQAQIKTLSQQGHSIRSIARVLRLSRRTVRKYLEPATQSESQTGGWIETVDWEYVGQEVYGKGTTVKQIQREVAPEIPYVKFWRVFRERVGRQASPHQVTIRLHHKPAEKSQIDFSDGLWITDPLTGKKTLAQFFLGVLPFSSYTFGEFVLDQKLPTFIGVQQRMFAYFGGVTPYVVVDNLKSGVHKADLYDPDVNPTYCDFANHMGFAVLPARPYKPRDKGSGECHIGVIQRGFFQEVRNRVWYSLQEINQALRDYLHRLNREVMKDYGVSRDKRFEEEKKHLKALPPSPFEISEWRAAKVHPDCHIQVEKNFYSVPFVYVGQKVRVRLTEKMVEVFSDDSQPIAAHTKMSGIGKFSTYDSHYPEQKLSVARFEVHHANEQAKQLGPHVEKLVGELLCGQHPLRHLRRVQGILRLAKRYPITLEALDHACQRAMSFNKTRLAYIKDCALYFVTHGQRPTLAAPNRQSDTLHLHQRLASQSENEEEIL